jgi:hypothetical protein
MVLSQNLDQQLGQQRLRSFTLGLDQATTQFIHVVGRQLDLQALHRVRERLVSQRNRHHQSNPRLPAGTGHVAFMACLASKPQNVHPDRFRIQFTFMRS